MKWTVPRYPVIVAPEVSWEVTVTVAAEPAVTLAGSTLTASRRPTADTSIPGEELANQSVRLKEEQLKREEDKLKEIELRVQREIQEKRQELLAKEESLRNLESRLQAQNIAE